MSALKSMPSRSRRAPTTSKQSFYHNFHMHTTLLATKISIVSVCL